MPPTATSLTVGSQDVTPAGFPHSDTCGSTLSWQLTALFRGLYVLLRQHVPRHPSRALSRLSVLFLISLLPDLSVPLLFAYSQISEVATPVALQINVLLLLFAFALFLIFLSNSLERFVNSTLICQPAQSQPTT
jgi:hypothetical protein